MSDRIVLKIGGSVLASDRDVRRAIHEIYRFHREGTRVLAVVSAFHGATDRLLALGKAAGANERELAHLLASGERESARTLETALLAAGIPTALLDPCVIGLRAEGPPFDSDPVAVDRSAIDAAHDRGAVVIVPGFFGVDRAGDVALLGRGGSDLSALFLAAELGARCRLIKDVPALFEWDPAVSGPNRPRAFSTVTFGTAERIGGKILQPKAVAFARRRDLAFELADWNSTTPTRVGSERDSFHVVATPRRWRIALLGCGAVGSAVRDALDAWPERFEITKILVRDVTRHADPRVTISPDAVFDSRPDLLIETLGGEEPAATLVATALERGLAVVSANKTMLAAHGPRLREITERSGAVLAFSASVGGAVAVLEACARLGADVRRVEGILNGTTAYFLDRVRHGDDPHAVLSTARSLGLAERDATKDLEGRDAAEKLVVLSHALGHRSLAVSDVVLDCAEIAERALAARVCGHALVQVATLDLDGEAPAARVELRVVDSESPWLRASGDLAGCLAPNLVILSQADGRVRLTGAGAGGRATAEAVIADVLHVARSTEPGRDTGAADSRLGGTSHARAATRFGRLRFDAELSPAVT